MNILLFGMLISLVVWGVFVDFKFIFLYLAVLILYHILHSLKKKINKQSLRQKIALASWGESGNPKVLSSIEIDCDKVDKFLEEHNEKNPEQRLTYTILGIKSIGNMMKDGAFSKAIRFGHIVKIPQRIIVLVDIDGKNLAQMPIDEPHKKSLLKIKEEMKGKIAKIKQKKDKDFNHQMNIIQKIPTYVAQALFHFSHFLSYCLGLAVPQLKVKQYSFGSCVLTNVSKIGCYDAYAPFIDYLNTNFLMVINTPKKKPCVIDGKPSFKKIMQLNLSFDQRFSEGEDVYECIQEIRKIWENPENYLN